jgi:UDP-glucose 4-epimerase
VKVRAERWVSTIGATSRLRTTILRCGNAYGPGQRVRRDHGVVAQALDCVRSGRPIPIIGSLESVRDYVYSADIAAVVGTCLELDGPDAVLNVGSGVGTSLRELLGAVATVTRASSTVQEPARPTDLPRVVLDITALRRVWPAFTPSGLVAGLTRTWDASTMPRSLP